MVPTARWTRARPAATTAGSERTRGSQCGCQEPVPPPAKAMSWSTRCCSSRDMCSLCAFRLQDLSHTVTPFPELRGKLQW